jgi:integrase
MRLANYLSYRSSGFSFRLVVPSDLQRVLGLGVIKQALRTHDRRIAQRCALMLAERYSDGFGHIRRMMMTGKKPTVEELKSLLGRGQSRDFELEVGADGVRLKTDGTEADFKNAMSALSAVERIGLMSRESYVVNAKSSQNDAQSGLKAISLGDGAKKYLLTLDAQTVKKTKTQKASAVNGFAGHRGLKTQFADVTRTDVSQWFEALRLSGIQTPTLTNKQSYLKAFFSWAQSAGYISAGDNLATGHIVYRTREKKQRRKFGFKAFTQEQISTLYSVEALSELNEQTRWGALIGLYTGARVTEVGQLEIGNIQKKDGVWAFQLTDEGEGQSLKNDASERWVPIHHDLIKLGLLEHVDALRASSKGRLFPRAKVESVNGAGNWLSKAFSAHRRKKEVIDGKLGFHSLRKTIIQKMQDGRVPAEYRAQYVGHELDDEHFQAYSREATMKELSDFVHRCLDFKLDIDGIRKIESENKKKKKIGNKK